MRGGDEWNQRNVHEKRILAPKFLPHLPDRFHEGQRFNVADSAANFDDCDINFLRDFFHRGFNFVSHMRNHLDGFAQIIPAPFFGNNLLVNTAGRPVVVARESGVGEALVMPEVEVRFRAVVGNENLPVLKRRHRARIDVQIRVELHQINFEPAAL